MNRRLIKIKTCTIYPKTDSNCVTFVRNSKLHSRVSRGSSVTAMTPKSKCIFRTAAMILYYIVQKFNLNKLTYLSKIY